jgi:hypothetical protein
MYFSSFGAVCYVYSQGEAACKLFDRLVRWNGSRSDQKTLRAASGPRLPICAVQVAFIISVIRWWGVAAKIQIGGQWVFVSLLISDYVSGDKAISETSESNYMQVFMVRDGVTRKGDMFSTHRAVHVRVAAGNAPDQKGKHIERNWCLRPNEWTMQCSYQTWPPGRSRDAVGGQWLQLHYGRGGWRNTAKSWLGSTLVQAVNPSLPTAAAQVRARVRSCGICGGESGFPCQAFHRLLQTGTIGQ